MSTAEKKLKVSLAEYFAYCDGIEGKAEFFNGEIFDMAGGTPEHAEIVSNFQYAVRKRLEGQDCGVYTQDLRIEVQAGKAYVYPDLTLICGPLQRSDVDQNSIVNPMVVVEVVSDSTAAFDYSGKRDHYMSIASVQTYILISQKMPKLDVFTRGAGSGWTFRQVTGLDATLELSSIPVAIPLPEIYRRVSFLA
jgi:Uma2 family endonuclease